MEQRKRNAALYRRSQRLRLESLRNVSITSTNHAEQSPFIPTCHSSAGELQEIISFEQSKVYESPEQLLFQPVDATGAYKH